MYGEAHNMSYLFDPVLFGEGLPGPNWWRCTHRWTAPIEDLHGIYWVPDLGEVGKE
jgi:hypothetical protein